jgi:acyl transferase domain-containing protein/NAD(P)-dependent dehydrogenase (short-subunit alcohol dehydrogenase family)/SAM-dependent methyltransferase/CTP:molybdopterin cytidylyltransferase MocA
MTAAERADAIAVVSLAARVPGADDVRAFWDNLCAARESISRFTADDLPTTMDRDRAAQPRFVGAEGVLGDVSLFDAGFFGYSPREAEVMDPQHRICLETAWTLFDTAGHDPAALPFPVGVFLGCGPSSYLVNNLLADRRTLSNLSGLSLITHNDKDFAATTLSYRLGLTGPSVNVGSGCSSSLVAVHLACRSLQTFECDMAVAGGVSVLVPQRQGYVHTADGVYSPDGTCAAFDADAAGTVGGSGAGLVLLKRLADAQRDGDEIHAVLLGSAVNNDGARKVGYHAPSVSGQRDVIAEAHAVADVSADSIGFVEAHGTGTPLGDPIEIEALAEAFRVSTSRTGFCAIGSVKTNIGHLDAAAGVVGLIKAVLAVGTGRIPASLHYRRPNPRIDFDRTPFYVNSSTIGWPPGEGPRRAGVSSFGIGGTNAHVVLQQPPPTERTARYRTWQPLPLSARTESALATASRNLAADLGANPGRELGDVAHTLAGRRGFRWRRAVVARDADEAATALAATHEATEATSGGVVFLFPGQGTGGSAPVESLYRHEPAFRTRLDEGVALLAGHGIDLWDSLGRNTVSAQPALFAVTYALSNVLRDWGITPTVMVGHSLGEYVAATLAGVFSPADALRLVVARARAQATLPPGRMLAVPLPAGDVAALLDERLTVAAVNAPDRVVVAGDVTAVDRLRHRLRRSGVATRLLDVDHAFHGPDIEAILDGFADALSDVEFHEPRSPYLSSVTGGLTDQVSAPRYWLDHMRLPVLFDAALRRSAADDPAVLLEVGPRAGLATLARRVLGDGGGRRYLSCLPAAGHGTADESVALLTAVARMWEAGCPVDWAALHEPQRPGRTALPAYPFERRGYWVSPEPRSPRQEPPVPATEPAAPPGITADLHVTPTGSSGDPIEGLDELCRAHIVAYLRGAGVTAPGEYTTRSLMARLRVADEFARFLDFMLTVLEEDGLLERGAGRIVVNSLDSADPAVLGAALKARRPDLAGLIDLLARCTGAYPAALTDPRIAVGVLYPDGDSDLLRRELGERTVDHRDVPALVQTTVEVLERLADRSGGPVRVLEVGAGEGRLTELLATALPPGGVAYHVTDVSRLFADRLRDTAGRRGVPLTTGVLDITRDPVVQGFTGTYDLVCGLDVLHVVPDVPAALLNLRRLVAPGGALAMVETVRSDRWTSMIWGLSQGWWQYTDGLRRNGPLLDVPTWRDVIAAQDFVATDVLTTGTGHPDTALVLAETAGAEMEARRTAPAVSVPGWRHAAPVPAAPAGAGATCLVFTHGPLGELVTRRLDALGVRVIRIEQGEKWSDTADHYRTLFAETGVPDLVLHLWGTTALSGVTDTTRLDAMHSLLFLAQALGTTPERPVRILAVTAGAQAVLGDDLTSPGHSTVASAIKVIPREYQHLSCTVADVPDVAPTDWLAARLVDELFVAGDTTEVAVRGRQRFRRHYEPVTLPAQPVRPQGVHLICGGLGGIGLSIARYLAGAGSRLVLTRRTPFPERSRWATYLAQHSAADPTARLITTVAELTESGAEVMVLGADVTDHDRMREVVAVAEDRFGPITGVVHAAGVPDTAGMIQRRDRAATDAAVAAKVLGATVLDNVLGDRDLDYFVLCSSLGAVLYKLKFGEVGYVAGNDFLDAFAAHRSQHRHGFTVSVNWTDWLEAGMWADSQQRLAGRYDSREGTLVPTEDLLGGLTEAEGTETFGRILAGRLCPRVVVTSRHLDDLLAKHERYSVEDHRDAVSGLRRHQEPGDRPDLPTAYQQPRTGVERELTGWWQDLLGFPTIGVRDDFFQLGGDSLIALRLLSLVRERYGVAFSVAQMFDAPTIEAQATIIADDHGGERTAS